MREYQYLRRHGGVPAGEQEQTPPEGFESSGSETVLGTEVKYDTPITRTITSAKHRPSALYLRCTLVETTSKGTGIRRSPPAGSDTT
ncbi:hypothetical protein [Escherichia coli]|uniref:hypothetical protein n=1 Tax=Escherichia coli TaxID=562 RepID=UPI003B280A53